MANNDYWAYLRSSNELKHYRVSIENGGSPNGYRKDGSQPVGQKAKGVRDRFGNYIYDAARNISSRISKRFGDLSEAIRRKQIIDRNSKMEAQRTNYSDMGHDQYGHNLKDPRFHSAYGSKGFLAQKNLEEAAEDASNKRKAALEEEYRNNHRDAQTERPQDRMKEGQAKARQEADERKMYEDWLAEQEKAKAKKREESLARNQANLDKWGYKDEDYDPNYLGNKAEDLKKLKEKLKESVSKKTIDRSSRPESKPEKKTVAVDANTGRVIPGYNPSMTENTGYRRLGEKWRKNKSRS